MSCGYSVHVHGLPHSFARIASSLSNLTHPSNTSSLYNSILHASCVYSIILTLYHALMINLLVVDPKVVTVPLIGYIPAIASCGLNQQLIPCCNTIIVFGKSRFFACALHSADIPSAGEMPISAKLHITIANCHSFCTNHGNAHASLRYATTSFDCLKSSILMDASCVVIFLCGEKIKKYYKVFASSFFCTVLTVKPNEWNFLHELGNSLCPVNAFSNVLVLIPICLHSCLLLIPLAIIIASTSDANASVSINTPFVNFCPFFIPTMETKTK